MTVLIVAGERDRSANGVVRELGARGWAITPRSSRPTARADWPNMPPMTGSSRPVRSRPSPLPGSNSSDRADSSWSTSKARSARATWSPCTNHPPRRWWQANSCPGGAGSCGFAHTPGRPWALPGPAEPLANPSLATPQSTPLSLTPSSDSWPSRSSPAAQCNL